ncbi:MAG: efflux RND transporter periplasmic adaptor subunit [Chloroflexi bacterium]|nr:efflux RND transporter periplasmic adaptor subunit [Chloroflexota bacterium]
MRKFLTYAVIGTLVAGALLGARELRQSQQASDEPPVEILDQTVVQRGNLRVTISATGAVSPQRQVPLLFESTGSVTEVLVGVGDTVRAGDVLARLDTAQAEATLNEALLALDVQQRAYALLTSAPRPEDLAVAQAALNSALAALNAAASTGVTAQDEQIAYLQSELARNQLWQAQLQRDIAANPAPLVDVSSLLPDGATNVPQELIDQANAALSGLIPSSSLNTGSLNAGLNQAEYGVAIADSNYNATVSRTGDAAGISSAQAAATAAQIALDRLTNGASDRDLQLAEIGLQQAELAVEAAQASVDRALLIAPFEGVIALNNLVIGELPPTQSAAMLLMDTSGYYVDIAADETDVVDLAVDQPVELDFDALPDQVLTGSVARINLLPTVLGQLVTYPVRVALDPTEQPVRVGMTATATVIVNELRDVLVVPNRFIRLDRVTGRAYLTVQDAANSFREVEVVLGLRNEIDSEIVSGVDERATIALIPRATFDPIRGF